MDNEKQKRKNRNILLKNILILFIKIVLILGIALVFLKLVFGFTVSRNIDMAPSISEGELLLFFRLEKNYNTDDVVVVNHDGKEYILRIVAKPNETVTINDKDELLINDLPESHTVFYKTTKPEKSNIKYPVKLKDNEYFVVGDYRVNSNDSRLFGPITKDEIKGVVIGKLKIRDI